MLEITLNYFNKLMPFQDTHALENIIPITIRISAKVLRMISRGNNREREEKSVE